MGRGPSIEGRKNAVDAKRGKIFTKIIREISVAARAGGGDPGGNPRLRTAIDKGLGVNMTREVIERAIKKATGELEGIEYEEIRYEGYAPGGVAVIVDCLTDNRVRTVADVRHAFVKFGGNMGTEGSVAFMFHKFGVLSFAPGADEDAITEAAIEAGADDIVVSRPRCWRRAWRPTSLKSPCAPTTTSPWMATLRNKSRSCWRGWKTWTTCSPCTAMQSSETAPARERAGNANAHRDSHSRHRSRFATDRRRHH